MKQPSIQPAPSAGSASLAYSIDTDALQSPPRRHPQRGGARDDGAPPPPIRPAESLDYSAYSGGEMSAEQALAAERYQEGIVDPHRLPPAAEGEGEGEEPRKHRDRDARPVVHEMHRKLLQLLSRPELFAEAMEWQAMVDRGADPSRPESWTEGEIADGMKSFDREFEEGGSLSTAATSAVDERKDGDAGAGAAGDDAAEKFKDQARLLPPLPLQIFAPDAEVVLPQALTATQLFGVERVSGIELEAAAGLGGLCQLFQRWLALMPEGDHANVVDPPGLTVMRIAGGRYRVTGAHRVVWRWMNKFSYPDAASVAPNDGDGGDGEGGEDDAADDFDFGDLVTMTIVDVFETDADGKLLSYCPTFDNRAVRRTQEVAERLGKGMTHLKERVGVAARSPAGKAVNKAAGNLGKMGISAALSLGNIVKNKIEEEIHKHQQGGGSDEESNGADSVGGEDAARGEEPAGSGETKGEGYSSDGSAGSRRRMEV